MADVKERGWSGAGGNTAPREDSRAPVILEDSRCEEHSLSIERLSQITRKRHLEEPGCSQTEGCGTWLFSFKKGGHLVRPEKVYRGCVFGRICGRMDNTFVEVEMEGVQASDQEGIASYV